MAHSSRRSKLFVKKFLKIVNDLREWPHRYDSYLFASAEFITAFLQEIGTPIPKHLEPEEDGGAAFAALLTLLVRDRLKRCLSRSKRDQALAVNRKTNRREPMNRNEKRIVGLIMVWFRHVPFAIDPGEVPPTSVGETLAVASAMPALARLLADVCENPDVHPKHLTWIHEFCVWSLGRKASGERSIATYYRAALDYILDEIERVADGVDITIEDLFGFTDDGSCDAPELATEPDTGIADQPGLIEDDSSEVQPLVATAAVELDWQTRLPQFVADYRRYDLQEVGRLLDKDDFVSYWAWHRQVCFAEGEPETGEDTPHHCFLQDLCRSGRRVALANHWGSGAEMALLWLSQWHSGEATDTDPVVLRIDAKKYAGSAAGESPFRFLARRIYGTDPDSRARRREFEEILRETWPIGLMQDLSRVSDTRQAGDDCTKTLGLLWCGLHCRSQGFW